MSTKITINNNGSVRVEGEFEIYDAKGEKFDVAGRTVISLCRCGNTQKAPFCDGSHSRCNYKSEVVACQLPPKK